MYLHTEYTVTRNFPTWSLNKGRCIGRKVDVHGQSDYAAYATSL